MDVLDMKDFAEEYCKNSSIEYSRKLNYQVCVAYEHITKQFGECTKKDIAIICEAFNDTPKYLKGDMQR